MRTLFLNPPSFEGFDGGASSRWPASREIESYWYPVWLCYPAGMLADSKVVDAPPHKISIEQTVEMAKSLRWINKRMRQKRSLREISTELATKGHLARSGKPYGPSAIQSMLSA